MNKLSRILLIGVGTCSVAFAVPKHQREFDYIFDRTPNVANGEKLYETCAACHGATGGGASDGSVPAIAGQHFTVLAKQIVDFRHQGRLDIRMQHFADDTHLALSQQIADVAAYISGMAPFSASKNPSADETGRAIYRSSCLRCHGANGEGHADWLVPRTSGQHFEYLARQLQETAQGIRPNMSKDHQALVATLDERSMAAVARYMSSLSPAR